MTKHIMLDLETLSTKPNAMILSIGAVSFDPHADGVIERFHCAIDTTALNASTAHLFDIDPATVVWWMHPDRAAARQHLHDQAKVDLPSALFAFDEWLGAQRGDLPNICIWGNAASFDNTILRRSYELIGMPAPWQFWSDRCYRTLKNLGASAPLPLDSNVAEAAGDSTFGVAHSALFDAVRQALHLQSIATVNALAIR